MPYQFKTKRVVEFSDTDMAGIVHFTAFFRWMESAEHAFYRSLGFSVFGEKAGKVYGWPRVHVECDYFAPLRFEEEVETHLLVRHKGRRSITYRFVFRRVGKGRAKAVARGLLTVVYVVHGKSRGGMTSIPMPAKVARRIRAAPVKALAAAEDEA